VASNNVLNSDSSEENYEDTSQTSGNPNEIRKRYCPSQH